MAQQANHPLPNGYRLEDYRIERQLSLGGFSIVYLARDAQERQVAIKEYLPNRLALRGKGQIQPVIEAEHQGAFRYGMKCFFEEGRALARLSHPNVVQVLNFFRANETVYMVMAYQQGRTLQECLKNPGNGLSERFIRGVFTRMLNGLREVHAHKLLHLDIKPSNIYLGANNSPVLIDFGAARQTLAAEQALLKPMYTPGFASPEHYEARESLGPWSDIYSTGASMYACLARTAPPAADQRLKEETLVPARARWPGRYSERLLEIIDACLCLDPLARPPSVFALQKALTETIIPPTLPAASPTEFHWLDRFVSRFRKSPPP